MSKLRTAILDTIHEETFSLVFQPIFRLHDGRCSGFEALARFPGEPYRPPNVWFADADSVGLGLQLETAVIVKALNALSKLPLDIYISINVSPAMLASGKLLDVLNGHPHDRIVLEVTEQVEIAEFKALSEHVRQLQIRGVRLAVDDAEAGRRGLRQTLRLRPVFIKLDMSITSRIDSDAVKRSVTAAMVHFASETGAEIIAEGIESEAEFDVLRALGVQRGQGWWLGRPVELDAALGFCRTERERCRSFPLKIGVERRHREVCSAFNRWRAASLEVIVSDWHQDDTAAETSVRPTAKRSDLP